MCDLCGCREIMNSGQEAIRNRVVEILQDLKMTAENLDEYEKTETISGLMAPFGNTDDDLYRLAAWVSSLHRGGAPQSDPDQRFKKYAHAFRDILMRLPVQGDARHIITTYHQLEQLARQLGEPALSSLDEKTRNLVDAVNHVHDDRTRQARVKEAYGL